MANYRVYRGSGHRLVAISVTPIGSSWIIRSGHEGKRLRITRVPSDQFSNYRDIKQYYVTDEYQLLFEGECNTKGEPICSTLPVLHWQAVGVDVPALCESLRELYLELESFDVRASLTDDVSGTMLHIGQNAFGISRAAAPCTIDHSGLGAGTAPLTGNTDLACCIALIAKSLPIALADTDGNAIHSTECVKGASRYVSSSMLQLLDSRGEAYFLSKLRLHPTTVSF